MISFETQPDRYNHWKLGFDGPVMPEPFSKALEDLAAADPLAAAIETARSMNELWAAAGL